MSVLIEGFTLIVQRFIVDFAYPGGAEAFLRDTGGLTNKPRFACNDDPQLVNIAFERPEFVIAATNLLERYGLVAMDQDEARDFVLVHENDGPAMRCSWLNWERFGPGVTIGWLAGRDPGALAAPAEWQAARPPATTATSHQPGDLFRLSTAEGIETYLNLSTGEQFDVPVKLVDELEPDVPTPAPLFDALMAALAGTTWVTYDVKQPAAMVDLQGEEAIYTSRYTAVESSRTIVCCTRCPVRVPKPTRRKATEFITRANFGLLLGGFDMCLDDGAIYYRASCRIADGSLTMEMVEDLAWAGVFAFDRYLPRLLEVVYGDRPVDEAVKEADA